MQHEDIIITLIKDHMVNTRLINGLNALGWHSTDYYLHLTDIIFKLVGLHDEHEELFEAYLDWCNRMAEKDIFHDEAQLHRYATDIYSVLKKDVE